MLSTVIDSMIAFDTSTPINCQVSSVSHVWPVILSQSDQPCSHSQDLGHCWTRECLLLYAHACSNRRFKISSYFSFATSSLLIVLRVYVAHLLQSSSQSKALKEAWQNRHLEQR